MMPMVGELYFDTEEPWREQSACASYSADVFFPPSDVPGAARTAKTICATCPVQEECLSFALDTGQSDGVWGGMDAAERRRYRRRVRDRARRKAS
jgi:WhiB family redox-sensing transcriptional regulator